MDNQWRTDEKNVGKYQRYDFFNFFPWQTAMETLKNNFASSATRNVKNFQKHDRLDQM